MKYIYIYIYIFSKIKPKKPHNHFHKNQIQSRALKQKLKKLIIIFFQEPTRENLPEISRSAHEKRRNYEKSHVKKGRMATEIKTEEKQRPAGEIAMRERESRERKRQFVERERDFWAMKARSASGLQTNASFSRSSSLYLKIHTFYIYIYIYNLFSIIFIIILKKI